MKNQALFSSKDKSEKKDQRGAVVEWLEQLGYGVESRHVA